MMNLEPYELLKIDRYRKIYSYMNELNIFEDQLNNSNKVDLCT